MENWFVRHARETKKDALEKEMIQAHGGKAPPPRSHYKIIMKWARENGFVWMGRHWGSGSLWRGNDQFALVNFQGRGLHVIQNIHLDVKIDWPSSAYGYRCSSIKEGIQILRKGKLVFEKPELSPKNKPERKPRVHVLKGPHVERKPQ